MESLKLENQKSTDRENDMTTQDLQSLLLHEQRESQSPYEEDKYQDTEKIAIQQNA